MRRDCDFNVFHHCFKKDVEDDEQETRFVELDPQRYMQMMYVVLSVQYFGILVMVINCISMLTRFKKYLDISSDFTKSDFY